MRLPRCPLGHTPDVSDHEHLRGRLITIVRTVTYRMAGIALAGLVGLCALAASLVAVSHGSASPASLATTLCRTSFGSKARNSAPGTVAQLRTVTLGGPQPYKPDLRAFPGVSTDTTIAWCWTGGPRDYTLYAVAVGFKPVMVQQVSGQGAGAGPPPAGRPVPVL